MCTSCEATSSHCLFSLLKILVDLVSNWEISKSMQSLPNTKYKVVGKGLNACEASFERLELMNVIGIVDQIGTKVMSKEEMEGVNLQCYQHSTLRVITPSFFVFSNPSGNKHIFVPSKKGEIVFMFCQMMMIWVIFFLVFSFVCLICLNNKSKNWKFLQKKLVFMISGLMVHIACNKIN